MHFCLHKGYTFLRSIDFVSSKDRARLLFSVSGDLNLLERVKVGWLGSGKFEVRSMKCGVGL